MEAPHVVILRKNLVYLKEHLEVGEVLDHLYQEGNFTQPEYNRCKQAGPDKCGTMLEILMKKGEDGYKSLCVVLDRSQPHIKDQLDSTSTEEGATSLLFVNKPKLDQQHKKDISKKEKIITGLQDKVKALVKEKGANKKELEAANTAREEDREKYLAQLDKMEQTYESNLQKERERKENAKEQVEKYEEHITNLEEKVDQLEKDLTDEKDKYEALTQLTKPQEPNHDDNEQQTVVKEVQHTYGNEACVFGSHSTCDVNQLMLLPCLHAACKACIDQHKRDEGRLLCPCGGATDLKTWALPADYVRRNEAAYNVSKDRKKKCTYIEDDHDEDATWYCLDCDEYLCPECKTIHGKLKINKNHRCDEIQEMETLPIQRWLKEKTCQDHPKHELVLYDSKCKKPVCVVCSHGTHKQHDKDDLKSLHGKTKAALEELLSKHRSKLESIRVLANGVAAHQNNLNEAANDLEARIFSVHQDVAGKFLSRQKQLLQDTRLSLEGPNQAVLEKLKTVRAAEKSVISTIDYIQRVMESTTKTELISLSDAVQKKSAEDLKIELPSDDTRDTRIRLFFQGQKALEESIQGFGSLATCTHMEEIVDSQPTLSDLCRKMIGLTESLTLTRAELKATREEMAVDKARITQFQIVHSLVDQGIPVNIVSSVEGDIVSCISFYTVSDVEGQVVSCPSMKFNRERVYETLAVSGDGLELVNWRGRSLDHQIDRFKKYYGTSSRLPIPQVPSTLTAATYWETHTRLQVKKDVSRLSLLEMAVCEEGAVDTSFLVYFQDRSSWVLRVGGCGIHPGHVCTQVWENRRQVRECLTDTMSPTPGTDVTLKYGITLDVGRGRLAFIDVNRGRVLHKFDLKFRETLSPLFCVWPSPDYFHATMRLISGQEVAMTGEKQQLIAQALFCKQKCLI